MVRLVLIHPQLWFAYILPIVLIGLAIPLGCVPAYRRQHDRATRKIEPLPQRQVTTDTVSDLEKRAGRAMLDVEQAKLFAQAVIDPRSIRQRIVDTYTPSKRTLEQRVSVELQLPVRQTQSCGRPGRLSKDVANDAVYVPIVIAPKGEMFDNFSIRDAQDGAISVLAYGEYLELAAAVLHALLRELAETSDTTQQTELDSLEERAIEQIVRRRLDGLVVGQDGEDATDLIRSFPAADDREHIKALAVALTEVLTDSYCVVAAVTPDVAGRALLKYQRTLIPDLDLSKKRSTNVDVKGYLRIASGTRPVELTVALQNATICKSYHLRLQAPDGLYMSEQEPFDFAEEDATDAPASPYLRFRRRLGQPYAHFYARHFPRPADDSSRPRIKYTFTEVPPGSIAPAAVSAVAAVALIWLIGVITSADPRLGTDAPAVLLAFPAVAAAWLGFEAPSARLFEGTLYARATLLATVVLSIGASGLFLTHPLTGDWPELPYKMSILGITDVPWSVLFLIALANATSACYKYCMQVWQFAYYSSREQWANDYKQHG